jgi:predicted lipid-binding transport protein (Tim44 family)
VLRASQATPHRDVILHHTACSKEGAATKAPFRLRPPLRTISIGEIMRGVLVGLAILLLIGWVLGFTVFHVTGFLIHLLLIVAVIAFVMQFFTGRTAV